MEGKQQGSDGIADRNEGSSSNAKPCIDRGTMRLTHDMAETQDGDSIAQDNRRRGM